MRPADLDAELAALAKMSLAQLRERWPMVADKPLPKVSAALLRLAIAWELQAAIHGGHSRQTLQKLEQIARGKTRTGQVQAGMRLSREWHGVLQTVSIDEDGVIRWNGKEWKSLSAVARAITGTRWSGPAFFGLKTKAAA
ncbi:DUF2924 domain-containing protein [Erythrobacter aurantius]|uniref:DUF2924 domain-containing protein n=1 Tax=Erythrobacter aurantius TaxID=2909249 RepID=UPI002079D712|nr:DUF2924 domain-containing protein [Erythrobacter aurantius]